MKVIVIISVVVTMVFGCSIPTTGRAFYVVFPGDATGIKVGTRIIYRGVDIGSVETVSLTQQDPTHAAGVRVGLRVTHEDVVLRKNDRFVIGSEGLLGDFTVEVIPASASSEPLAFGATVEGEVPLKKDIERLIESIDTGSKRDTDDRGTERGAP